MKRELFNYAFATASNNLKLVVQGADNETKVIFTGDLYNIYQPNLTGYTTTDALNEAIAGVTASIQVVSNNVTAVNNRVNTTNTNLFGATSSIRSQGFQIADLYSYYNSLSNYTNDLDERKVNTFNTDYDREVVLGVGERTITAHDVRCGVMFIEKEFGETEDVYDILQPRTMYGITVNHGILNHNINYNNVNVTLVERPEDNDGIEFRGIIESGLDYFVIGLINVTDEDYSSNTRFRFTYNIL